MQDCHQVSGAFGEKVEARVTTPGKKLYTHNMLHLGGNLVCCYTAQQDALDGEKIVEVKTLNRSPDQPLPLSILIACFLRDVDELVIVYHKEEAVLGVRRYSREELPALDMSKKLRTWSLMW